MKNLHGIVHRLLQDGRMPTGPDLAHAVGSSHPVGDHFVFASPSLREGSKHSDLAALEPLRAYAMTRPGVLSVEDGHGYWADGKEESGLVWVATPGHVQELAQDLRDRFNQKGTIGFAEDREGPDDAHVLHTAEKNPDKIHDGLMRHGVEYKTVIPMEHGSTVYVLDSDRVQKNAVKAWAGETGAHMTSVPGRVHFEGGDERPRPIGGPTMKLSRADASKWARRLREPKADETDFSALKDHLDEEGDPRADLIAHPDRKLSFSDNFKTVRKWSLDENSDTRSHKFPDGTFLYHKPHHSRHGMKLERPWHTVGWVLSEPMSADVPGDARLPRRFVTTMEHDEFQDWVAKFPEEEQAKMREVLKLPPPKTTGPTMKLALEHSMNKARRIGSYFVKTPKEGGSPHAEHAAADVFRTIGLPHIPVQHRNGRVFSKWIDGLQSIEDAPEKLKQHATPDRVAHIGLGEWLVGAGDRVARNYQTHPTLGLLGNDYGHAFHPLTNEWGYIKMMKDRGRKPAVESYNSLALSPNKYAENHPHASALPASLRNLYGITRDDHSSYRVPSHAVEAALKNEQVLIDAAHRATTDLPEDERAHAVAAMKARLAALREHVTNRGPVTVGDLVTLTQKVRDEAVRRGGPRPV